jgi:hypothetical protein
MEKKNSKFWEGEVKGCTYAAVLRDGEIYIYDEDGDVLFTIREGIQTEFIPDIIKVRLEAFESGIKVGKLAKQCEIKKALGMI